MYKACLCSWVCAPAGDVILAGEVGVDLASVLAGRVWDVGERTAIEEVLAGEQPPWRVTPGSEMERGLCILVVVVVVVVAEAAEETPVTPVVTCSGLLSVVLRLLLIAAMYIVPSSCSAGDCSRLVFALPSCTSEAVQ